MAITVNLRPEVRDWIAQNLARGVTPRVLAGDLSAHDIEPELAAAMVETVARSLVQGMPPVPGGNVPDYVPVPMRIAPGTRVRIAEREVRVLARLQRPAAALLEGLLDESECAQLIALAQPRLRRSTVTDPVTGREIIAGHRSSDGMFFRLGEHPLVAALEERICRLTGTPAQNGEGLQVLHYRTGAQTTPHLDYLQPSNQANRESIARSGQRISTLILYLNDVEAGGETIFTAIGLALTPRRGQALYFEYVDEAGRCDPASLHSGAPVLAGDKWIATKWMRSQKFVPRSQAGARR